MLKVGKILLAALLAIHFSFFPRVALASTATHGFSASYVNFYKKFSTTYALAQEAEKYVAANPNMAALIKKVRASADEPLPSIQLRQGVLFFKSAGKTDQLSHRGGSQFLWNSKLIDLSKDLSTLTASSNEFSNWLLPSANAVAPLVILVVAVMFIIAGAMVCTNLNVEQYFGDIDLRIEWKKPPGQFNRYLKGIQSQVNEVCPGAANAAEISSDYDYERFFANYCGALTPNYRETRSIMASRHSVHQATAERFYGSSVTNVNKSVIAALVNDTDFMSACLEGNGAAANPSASPGTGEATGTGDATGTR